MTALHMVPEVGACKAYGHFADGPQMAPSFPYDSRQMNGLPSLKAHGRWPDGQHTMSAPAYDPRHDAGEQHVPTNATFSGFGGPCTFPVASQRPRQGEGLPAVQTHGEPFGGQQRLHASTNGVHSLDGAQRSNMNGPSSTAPHVSTCQTAPFKQVNGLPSLATHGSAAGSPAAESPGRPSAYSFFQEGAFSRQHSSERPQHVEMASVVGGGPPGSMYSAAVAASSPMFPGWSQYAHEQSDQPDQREASASFQPHNMVPQRPTAVPSHSHEIDGSQPWQSPSVSSHFHVGDAMLPRQHASASNHSHPADFMFSRRPNSCLSHGNSESMPHDEPIPRASQSSLADGVMNQYSPADGADPRRRSALSSPSNVAENMMPRQHPSSPSQSGAVDVVLPHRPPGEPMQPRRWPVSASSESHRAEITAPRRPTSASSQSHIVEHMAPRQPMSASSSQPHLGDGMLGQPASASSSQPHSPHGMWPHQTTWVAEHVMPVPGEPHHVNAMVPRRPPTDSSHSPATDTMVPRQPGSIAQDSYGTQPKMPRRPAAASFRSRQAQAMNAGADLARIMTNAMSAAPPSTSGTPSQSEHCRLSSASTDSCDAHSRVDAVEPVATRPKRTNMATAPACPMPVKAAEEEHEVIRRPASARAARPATHMSPERTHSPPDTAEELLVSLRHKTEAFKGLDGLWRTAAGQWRIVTMGWLAGQPLRVEHGTISCDNWVVTNRGNDSVTWSNGGASEDWKRPDLAMLEGPWVCSETGWANVIKGMLGDSALSFTEGWFRVGPWVTTNVSHDGLTWSREGELKTWSRPKRDVLEGSWISAKGNFKRVKEGIIDGAPIEFLAGRLRLRDWIATCIADDKVVWKTPDGRTEKWTRPTVELLNGPWLSTQGGWRNVVNGVMHCEPIVIDKGMLRLASWVLVGMTERSATWESCEETVVWNRPTPEAITGPWLTPEDVFHNIMYGSVDGVPIEDTGKHLLLNGWRVNAVFGDWMLVRSVNDNTETEWARPQVDALEGPWLSSMSGWRNVVDGVVDGGLPIMSVDGVLQFDVWKVAAMTHDSVTWEDGGEKISWQRPTPDAINGPWMTSRHEFLNVKEGHLDNLPIDLFNGWLVWNRWEAASIFENRIIWRHEDGHEEEWTRPHCKLLDGPWKVDGQQWIHVTDGQFGDVQITMQRGRLTLNGMICTVMEDEKTVWEMAAHGLPKQTITWRRPCMDDFEGPWLCEEDHRWHNINDGAVADPFVVRSAHEHLVKENGHTWLAGRQAVAITESIVTWRASDVTNTEVTWRRPQVSALDGPWRSSDGCWRNVNDNQVMGAEIVVDKGRLLRAGWCVAYLNDTTVVWKRGEEVSTWSRLLPDDLDGPWLQEKEGIWHNIDGGQLPQGPIRFQDGVLLHAGWVLQSVSNESLGWRHTDATEPMIWRCPKPSDLNGPWLNSDKGWLTVTNGSSDDIPIDVQGWGLMFNGWAAIRITDTSVRWLREGSSKMWHRPKPEALGGSWLGPDGSFRTVTNGFLDREPIEEICGRLFHRGYEVISISDDRVVWKKETGQEEVWTRPQQTPLLDGPWICQKRGWQNVVNGAVDGRHIVMDAGMLKFDSWTLTAIVDRTVTWDSCGSMTTWQRPKPDALDGAWIDGTGKFCNVKCGIMDGIPIQDCDGRLLVNGWTAVCIYENRVIWHCQDGKRQEWTRPGPKMLDGAWHVDGHTWITVRDGALPEGPIDFQNGRLVQNSMTCVSMQHDKVIWDASFLTEAVVWYAPTPTCLDGPWLDSDHTWITVADGMVEDFSITQQRFRLVFKDWLTTSITQRSVTWEQEGFKRVWQRPKPEALNGPWMTADGSFRNIVRGELDDVAIEDCAGHLLLRDWKVLGVSSQKLTWLLPLRGREVWTRPTPQLLEGPWINQYRCWANVDFGTINGHRIVACKGTGLLQFDGWTLYSMGHRTVTWRSGGETLEWQRPTADMIEGPWQTARGQFRNVEEGRADGDPIDASDGCLRVDRWEAVFIVGGMIRWRDDDGVEKEWRRPQPQSLDGPWHTDESTWINVANGRAQQGPIDVDNDRLVHSGMICVRMEHGKVTWQPMSLFGAQPLVVWHRPTLEHFAGPWLDMGGFHNVVEGKVKDPFSESSLQLPLVEEHGRVRLSAWLATAMTETSVTWEEGGTAVTWHRPQVSHILGAWKASTGEWKNCIRGRIDHDPVFVVHGRLVCAGWAVESLSHESLSWKAGTRTSVWTRPSPEDLDGPWFDDFGVWRNVENGRLPDSPIRAEAGHLKYGDWELEEASREKLTWTKTGTMQAVTWRCPRSADVQGPWLSQEHGWLHVRGGRVDGTMIQVNNGQMSFKGWVAVAITESRVRWKAASGRCVEWHRPYSEVQNLSLSAPT